LKFPPTRATPHSTHLVQKSQNRQPQLTLSRRTAALARSSPFSTLLMVPVFLRSPIWDSHVVKSRLRTGVPFSPESDAPKSSFHASPPFHTTTLFSGGYMQCTYARYILFRALSFLPLPPPHVGPHDLGHSISGSTPLLSCAKARQFVSCEPVSVRSD
jgi:hypothetical protein